MESKEFSFYLCLMHSAIRHHILKYVQASEQEIKAFCSYLQPINVPKKSFLLQPNQHVSYEYFVIKGCLRAYYMDDKGNKHIVQFAVEDWWVGDFDAFYNEVPSNLYVQAIEESELLSISKENIEALFKQYPVFERYFRLLVTSAFISQQKRILSSLQKNTQERYIDFCNTYPNIEDRVPNYHIANYLGVSAESISRIRRVLKG